MAATKLFPANTSTNNPFDITAFGGKSDGSADVTDIANELINLESNIHFPAGTYRVDGEIELKTGERMSLANGAMLRRMSQYSGYTGPVVWIRGVDAVLEGEGQDCMIESENSSPLGVVLVGYRNITDDRFGPGNTRHATIANMHIKGAFSMGDGVSSLLRLAGVGVCYFNRARDLKLSRGHIGLFIEGEVNANLIRDIHVYDCQEGLHLHAGYENSINGFFYHKSPDGVAIMMTDRIYEGGGVGYPSLNMITNFMAEPGGVAQGLNALNSLAKNNILHVQMNAGGGNAVYAGFYRNNKVITAARARELRDPQTEAFAAKSFGWYPLDMSGKADPSITAITLADKQSPDGGQLVLYDSTGSLTDTRLVSVTGHIEGVVGKTIYMSKDLNRLELDWVDETYGYRVINTSVVNMAANSGLHSASARTFGKESGDAPAIGDAVNIYPNGATVLITGLVDNDAFTCLVSPSQSIIVDGVTHTASAANTRREPMHFAKISGVIERIAGN